MSKKRPSVAALRGVRKASHISRRASTGAAHIFGKIENKVSKVIVEKTGSESGKESVSLDDFFYKEFPYLFPIHPALPAVGQKPSVTVFVPNLSARGFYGGIATLLITSACLAKKLGYDYRVVQTSGFEKNNKVLEFLASKNIHLRPDSYSTIDVSFRNPSNFAYLPLHPDDVIVVSAWWDAYTASQLPLSKKFVYMLQDYEPIFYNNGDQQQFAESTYHTDNFIPLCNTKLMMKYFKSGNYPYIQNNATWFEPAVAVPQKERVNRKTKNIFLYGRPQVHRNMFFTAIKALDTALLDPVFSKHNWNIYCAGQADIPNIRLKSGHIIKNLGKLDIQQYYDFTKTVDIAVSPMLAPHPNYPTLELASTGATVVTTKYKTKDTLRNYSKNILLSEPTVEDMSSKIIKACAIALDPNTTIEHSIESDWVKALEDSLKDVIEQL